MLSTISALIPIPVTTTLIGKTLVRSIERMPHDFSYRAPHGNKYA